MKAMSARDRVVVGRCGDRREQLALTAGVGPDDLLGSCGDERGERGGRGERLVDGPGEVPGVDEELDAEDAHRHRRRRRAVAERDVAVSATFAPRRER